MHAPAFELKGTLTPVTVLRLRTVELDRFEQELRARVEPVPQLFLNAPVVIDVADLDGDVPLGSLTERIRRCRLVPVGVANLHGERVGLAADAGLAVVQLGPQRKAPEKAEKPPEKAAAAPLPVEAPREHAGTMTIRQPVRGGQVVYAKDSDLVVLAPVNAGAQVIADGHVHIYGPLRGRALAGAQGWTEARVFCQSLEAELVSIAGNYLLADEIPAERRGQAAQIFNEHDQLRVGSI